MEKVEETPKQILPEEEKEKILQNFINEAIELTKEGEYKKAINHLWNPGVAEKVGFDFDEDARSYLVPKKLTEEDIKILSANVAMDSEFTHKPGQKPTIKTADVFTTPTEKGGREIPSKVWHEVSLIRLEEWLHGLQYIRKKPLAGLEDMEKDVLEYLQQRGVPVTDNFIDRH